ncbi:MAG TPA: hypothetical protein VMB85_28095 [Bryobacteraceae bacterium]|nr:hypothetical protein [Bryobacteraceae bacterium]
MFVWPEPSRPSNCISGDQMDSKPGVVLLGDIPYDPVAELAAKFGWPVENASCFEDLRKIHSQRGTVAVLFEPAGFGLSWEMALDYVRQAAPGALVIVCRRFSDTLDWSTLAARGAFHMISLPVKESELRQSLGFIWAANRRAHQTKDRPSRAKKQAAGQLVA